MMQAHSYISRITPYVGGDVTPQGMTRRVVLASNENPLGYAPSVQEALHQSAFHLSTYPLGEAMPLRSALANAHNLDEKRILCGSGSDELIHLLCRAFLKEGDEAIMPEYGFSAYFIAITASGAACIKAKQPDLRFDVDSILNAVTPRTKIVFIDNPANPLGVIMERKDVMRLRDELRKDILLVLDEAYAEYVESDLYETGLTLFKDAENVMCTRTFSKIYGLAGIRLGWCYAPLSVIDGMNRVRQPFNVNRIAQAIGPIALEGRAWIAQAKTHNTLWRAWTQERIEALGYHVNPAHGNFLLMRTHGSTEAKSLYQFLGTRGVLVRPVANYNLPEHLRISIGTEENMREFISLLEAYTTQHAP